MEILIRN